MINRVHCTIITEIELEQFGLKISEGGGAGPSQRSATDNNCLCVLIVALSITKERKVKDKRVFIEQQNLLQKRSRLKFIL